LFSPRDPAWVVWNYESMSNTKQDSKVRVRTNLRSGGPILQHGVRIRTGVKAGGLRLNHGVRVRTGVKAGGFRINHGVRVRHSSR
jgi:hypothetical protein